MWLRFNLRLWWRTRLRLKYSLDRRRILLLKKSLHFNFIECDWITTWEEAPIECSERISILGWIFFTNIWNLWRRKMW